MSEPEAAVFKYMSSIMQSLGSLFYELCFLDLLLFVHCSEGMSNKSSLIGKASVNATDMAFSLTIQNMSNCATTLTISGESPM